jgi:hypothetical protein
MKQNSIQTLGYRSLRPETYFHYVVTSARYPLNSNYLNYSILQIPQIKIVTWELVCTDNIHSEHCLVSIHYR